MSMKKVQMMRIRAAIPFIASTTAGAIPARTIHGPVAPREEQLRAAVNEAYSRFTGDANGKNADYIPYLAHLDSKLFGVAAATTDNRVYTLGDIDYSFPIQSISRVLTLALARQELGADTVFARVGSEPTGRPFNSVPAVVDVPTPTGNPLVNAGAIARLPIT